MALTTLKYDINNLNWLCERKGKKAPSKTIDIHREAHERGSLILTEILGLFPDLKQIHEIPRVRASGSNRNSPGFLFNLALQFYESRDSTLVIVRYSNIPNHYCSHVITDLGILLTDPKWIICKGIRERSVKF